MGGARVPGNGKKHPRDRGRRVRALAMFQALLCLPWLTRQFQPPPPDVSAPIVGYRDRGAVRVLRATDGVEAIAEAAAGCEAGTPIRANAADEPIDVLEPVAESGSFFRTICPPRAGHWPLPTSLLFGLPLDLNELDVADFEALDGVGPVLARRIVAKRAELNGFRSAEDLLLVRGVGEKTYRRILSGLAMAGDGERPIPAPFQGAREGVMP